MDKYSSVVDLYFQLIRQQEKILQLQFQIQALRKYLTQKDPASQTTLEIDIRDFQGEAKDKNSKNPEVLLLRELKDKVRKLRGIEE